MRSRLSIDNSGSHLKNVDAHLRDQYEVRWASNYSVVVRAIIDGFPSVSCQQCRRYHSSNRCARESVG